MILDFSNLTIKAITAGALAETLPELYRLTAITEASSWHNDDPFTQSVHLFTLIKSLPNVADFPVKGQRAALNALLHAPVEHYSMHTLLAFTALIHDIGKADTFEQMPDGTTRCPGHEAAGAKQAPAICARFNFSARETELITTLVRVHGEPYALHKKIAPLPANEQMQKITLFEQKHAPYLRPLLLLAWGDMATSHLRTRDPEKYRAVNRFYRLWLNRIWAVPQPGNELQISGYDYRHRKAGNMESVSPV